MLNTNNRLNDALNKLTDTEQYELLKELEKKDTIFDTNNNNDNTNDSIIELLVDTMLDVTTLVAKLLHIVK